MTDMDRLNEMTLEQAVDVLATMSPLEYDKAREGAAKNLGVRVSTLDAEVEKLRKADSDDGEVKGRSVELYEPEPWPEPVDGAEALGAAYQAIRRHMVIRDEYAITAALWAAHTHVYDVFSHSPRLGITAPDAECGKSLLGTHLVGSMVPRPLPVELMKPAPFFRLAEAQHPTFLIMEVDVFLKEDSDLLAAINNGWEPHGGVVRCVGEGSNMDVRIFSTHTPVSVDGINLHKVLPATTMSRTLVINLERATPDEVAEIEVFDARKHGDRLLDIGRQLARWAADNRSTLRAAEPTLPDGAIGRRADKWTPLFAIAETAGGDWPERVRQAYMAEEDTPKLSISLQLLADIRSVLNRDEPKIWTENLINRLGRLEGSPWSSYNFKARDEDQRRISDRQLSNLLRDYHVKPVDVRIGEKVRKGYRQQDILNACRRYLPSGATPLQASDHAGSSDSQSATPSKAVADANHPKPAPDNGCSDVADTEAHSREVRL